LSSSTQAAVPKFLSIGAMVWVQCVSPGGSWVGTIFLSVVRLRGGFQDEVLKSLECAFRKE
jgi:hypothetical protein